MDRHNARGVVLRAVRVVCMPDQRNGEPASVRPCTTGTLNQRWLPLSHRPYTSNTTRVPQPTARTHARLQAFARKLAESSGLLVPPPPPITTCDAGQGQPLQPLVDTYRRRAGVEAELLLPCTTQLVTRMGASNLRGAIWCPPRRFPGTHPCMQELLLYGPLGQVGELAATVGQRLHVAVEELRAAVAAGPTPEGSCGARTVRWLAVTASEAMQEAAIRLGNTFCALTAMQALRGSNAPGEGRLTASDIGVRVGALAVQGGRAAAAPPLSRGLQPCAEFGRNPDRHPSSWATA